MDQTDPQIRTTEPDRQRSFRLPRGMRRFARSSDGAAALEFALLALPYFLIIFAILETFIAFTGEQLITNATDTMARKIRTGQITNGLGRTTDLTQKQFRQQFCNEIALLISCSLAEVNTPTKLYLDVRKFSSFNLIPKNVPRKNASDPFSDIDTSSFGYTFGGPETINMVRAVYRWKIATDLVRPYITTIRPNGVMPTDFLIVATAAVQNEKYP